MPSTILAITGHRAIARESEQAVRQAMAEALAGAPSEIRFGGALGVDTLALTAAHELRQAGTRLVVYAPATIADLPRGAREVAERCADHVVELEGDPRNRLTYLQRNDAMLDGADQLVAFWNGTRSGGTWYTVRKARELGFEVKVVAVTVRGAGRGRPSGPHRRQVQLGLPWGRDSSSD